MDLIRPTHYAVFFSDAEAGAEMTSDGRYPDLGDVRRCLIFDSLAEAEQFSRQKVTQISNLRCDLFDSHGRANPPVAAFVSPLYQHKLDLPAKARRMMRWGLVGVAASLALFALAWVRRGEWWLAAFFGVQLLFSGLRLLRWGYGMKEELNYNAGSDPNARIARMSKPRAKKIKLILFDVDGVLTDGKIWIFPAPPGAQQSVLQEANQHRGEGGFGFNSAGLIEAKGFHAHDGTAISLARLAGLKTGIITKRLSETVALRARDLKIDHVHQGIQDKAGVFQQILKEEGITAAEAAFVGDDVIDLPVMRKCGLAIAVKNARPEVKSEAHWITPHPGGDGAARDAVEYILNAQGKWKRIVEGYISERGG